MKFKYMNITSEITNNYAKYANYAKSNVKSTIK